MSTEAQQWLMIAAGGAVALFIIIAIARSLRAMNAIWPDCAKKLGLTFREESTGGAFTSRSEHKKVLEGVAHGVPIRLVESREQVGNQRRSGTHVSGRSLFPTPHQFSMRIERPSAGGAHFHAVATGDPQFDARFVLKSDAPALTRALIDPNVRAIVAALPMSELGLSYDRGEICLSWASTPTKLPEIEVPIHVVLAAAHVRLP